VIRATSEEAQGKDDKLRISLPSRRESPNEAGNNNIGKA